MPPRRTDGLAAIALLVLLLGSATRVGAVGLVDPILRFRQIRTEHFVIYYHPGEELLAARLATIAEAVRTEVSGSLSTPPPRLTHVVLADQAEVANGWASPLPRDTVFLNAAVPSGADFIGRTDDWLRLVFTHEFTHIVHLDRSGGWARPVRWVFGRAPIAFPNLWLPQWQIEGLATWEESLQTGNGRLYAGDFRAIERVAAAAGRPIPLDRASGGLVGWPDGHAAYAAGLGFHEYLADRFGQASFGDLSAATARRLPFLGSRAFRPVYGESLGTLWREYEQQLTTSSAQQVPADHARRLTTHGNIVSGPRYAPACSGCTGEVVYSVRTPDAFPSLRAVDTDSGHDRQLTTRYMGSTIGISAAAIVFDQQEIRRNVGMYSDLYLLDRASGATRALTTGSRLQDPDLAPDGRSIVAVREAGGHRDLVVARLQDGGAPGQSTLSKVETLASGDDLQFSAPRWSPDGRSVATERRQRGRFPDVVVIDAATGDIERVLAIDGVRIVTPAWRPDGAAIVAAAEVDGGPFDLYEFPLTTDKAVRRLTRSDGALWPDVSADGRRIVFAGYTVDGYDVFEAAYEPIEGELPTPGTPAVSLGSEQAPAAILPPSRTYSPLGTLAPTTWSPLVLADSEQTRIGASVAGSDLLGRHAYAVDVSWLASGPDVVRPLDAGVPDWSATYAYIRWRPSLFATLSRESIFSAVAGGTGGRALEVAGIRHQLEAGVYVPFVHVRRNAQVLGSLVRSVNRYALPDGDRETTLASARFGVALDTTKRYGYSISREHGLDVGTTLEMTRRGLGSDADATTSTADVRAYLPGAGRHHVVALRAAAGYSTGETAARQAFSLGSVAASPGVIDFGADALGLFRGAGTRTGDRVVVANAEYRLPLAVIERGHGTWPLLLRTVHASVFADAGEVRNGAASGTGWSRAVGGELSLDAVAGYALPFAVSVGTAWGHDGQSWRGATVYARLGRAF